MAEANKYLIFTLGLDDYGIEIKYVTEIVGIQTITEVPEMPEYIMGVINLRGKIIPVMDVRLRFKKQAGRQNDRACVIIVNMEKVNIGLVIDSVTEVLTIPESEIISPPKYNKGFQHSYIKGIGKVGGEVKLLLNCEEMLNDNELIRARGICKY